MLIRQTQFNLMEVKARLTSFGKKLKALKSLKLKTGPHWLTLLLLSPRCRLMKFIYASRFSFSFRFIFIQHQPSRSIHCRQTRPMLEFNISPDRKSAFGFRIQMSNTQKKNEKFKQIEIENKKMKICYRRSILFCLIVSKSRCTRFYF